LRIRRILLSLLFLTGAAPPEASALTDEEIFEAFQFNFSQPGARSAGMGRAFVGLADDATASVSNPAGLTTLQFPEVSLEVKLTDHNIRRRVPDATTSEPSTRVFGSAVPQLSFLSLVYAYKGLTLGIYRYETFNFDENFGLPERQLSCCRLPKVDAQIDMTISNWGGTVAFRLPKNFSFGVAMSAVLLDMETRTTRFAPDGVSIHDQSLVSDVAWSLSSTLGALYRPSELFSAGLFYSFNPRFTVREELSGQSEAREPISLRIKVPDRIGAGFAVRPVDELTVVFDLLRVQYSQQTGGNSRTLVRFPDLNPRDFFIDDGWELHGGLEYVVLTPRDIPISTRFGLFTNPAHPLRYGGPVDSEAGQAAAEVFGAASRSTDLAITIGLGAVFAEYLQADVAYLNAAQFDEVTASVIFHFQ
jgi:long-subunit fatty acid transport protein